MKESGDVLKVTTQIEFDNLHVAEINVTIWCEDMTVEEVIKEISDGQFYWAKKWAVTYPNTSIQFGVVRP